MLASLVAVRYSFSAAWYAPNEVEMSFSKSATRNTNASSGMSSAEVSVLLEVLFDRLWALKGDWEALVLSEVVLWKGPGLETYCGGDWKELLPGTVALFCW